MLKYFIKHFFRNITRRKLFSFINITGLAFGIAFMIMIGQFIYHEFNYNNSIRDLNDIYRLADDEAKNYNLDYRTKDLILEKVPGIKDACLFNRFGVDINAGEKALHIDDMFIVDPAFFKFFGFPFIYGNQEEALKTIDGVVLTESFAKNIFGTSDALGKTLQLNHQYDMIVTGIIKDLHDDLSFDGQIFVNYENTPKQRLMYKMSCVTFDGKDDSQCNYPFNIFIKLDRHANIGRIENQISGFHDLNKYRFAKKVALAPMSSNYFNIELSDDEMMHGNVELIKILSIIGSIILLLAIINFVNLATAVYKYRLTEIGVKKCFGANRQILIKQLLTESLFTCIISGSLGIIFSEIFLPYFNNFVDKPLTLQIFSEPVFLGLFISFLLLLGFLTGFFPAAILSRISPIEIFKFNPILKGARNNSRGILTIFQFAITIILVSGLIIINGQIDFVKHKDLGFNTSKLLYLKVHYTLGNNLQVLSNKLRQFHNIKSLTTTMGIPGKVNMSCDNHDAMVIDSTSLETFGFKIIKGRDLLPGDVNKACLVNAEALKNFKDGEFMDKKVNGSDVVGVVSDFNYSSLHNKTAPLALFLSTDWGRTHITLRASGNIGETIKYIEKTWKEVCPDYQLEYGFYDDHFASMYKKEENLASLVSIFSILAVVISCMGIFGLSVYQSEQRIKEIGIRKVLGASTSEIVFLLTKSFSKWVIFANVIAVPAAYYFLNEWLQEFAYKIEITWWMFAIAGGIALMIALPTVSFQAIKAATANPVESLRYE
jgi:putative ABC transport system permease protein